MVATVSAPENGMITSEGRGMQADSMAISKTMPPYPLCEITEMMKALSAAIILEVIRMKSSGEGGPSRLLLLSEGVARESQAFAALLHLDAHSLRGAGGRVGGPHHRELGEHFVVNLGDEIILSVLVVAPHLAELN